MYAHQNPSSEAAEIRMGLRDIESSLPPGFRFFPSDEELLCHYLLRKLTNQTILSEGTLVEVDLHTHEPWELPDEAKLNANEWYFFSFRDRKYATGSRTNRATKSGYWKATGKDRTICDPRTQAVVGMRKTLVFYRGRAPNGTKTCWVMHEFRLEIPHSPPKEDWVLCRVFNKRKGDGAEQEDAGSSSPSPADHLPGMPPEYSCGLHEQLSSSLISASAAPLLQEDSGSSFNNSNLYRMNDMAALLQCGWLDYFPQQDAPAAAALETSSTRYDGHDELGFLLDLGFDEHGVLGDAGMPKWQE